MDTEAQEIESSMIKSGVVVVGVTPSAQSGKPSEMIKEGEAILEEEQELHLRPKCNCKCDGSCKRK